MVPDSNRADKTGTGPPASISLLCLAWLASKSRRAPAKGNTSIHLSSQALQGFTPWQERVLGQSDRAAANPHGEHQAHRWLSKSEAHNAMGFLEHEAHGLKVTVPKKPMPLTGGSCQMLPKQFSFSSFRAQQSIQTRAALAGGLNLNQFRRLDSQPGIQISPHLLQKGCKATPEDHESWNPAVSLNSPRTRPSLQLRRPGETSNARRPKNGQAKERDEPLQVVLVDPRRDILVDLVNLGTLWRSFRWGFMSNHFSGNPRS